MKLSKTERTILTVFLVIVILVAGTLMFIWPAFQKIDVSKRNLESAKAERENVYVTLQREETIDDEVKQAYDDAKDYEGNFYKDLQTQEADVIVRKILEDAKMSTDSLSISDLTTSTLALSDFTEIEVTYPLKEYSKSLSSVSGEEEVQYDEDGNVIMTPEMKYAELAQYSQVVGAISVNFMVEGRLDDLKAFLDRINALPQATYIQSITIPYTASASSTSSATEIDEDGNEITVESTTETTSVLKDSSKVSTSVNLILYCVNPMDVPELDN